MMQARVISAGVNGRADNSTLNVPPVRGEQPHAIDAGDPSNCNHVGRVLEIDIVIGLNIGDPLHANSENVAQPFAQVIPLDRFVIHHHPRMFFSPLRMMDLNNNRPLRRRDRVVPWAWLLRNFCLQTDWPLLDHNQHKNDDKH